MANARVKENKDEAMERKKLNAEQIIRSRSNESIKETRNRKDKNAMQNAKCKSKGNPGGSNRKKEIECRAKEKINIKWIHNRNKK